MASRTRYYNLTKLGSGEDVHTEGFANVDRDTIDQALHTSVRHRHTGDVFAAPDTAPELFLEADGTLPAGTRIRYTYTWTHPDMGESRPAPIAEVTTPAPIPEPAPPTLSDLQTLNGSLPPGQYYYVLTAYQGDTYTETKAANPLQVTIPTGTSTNSVTLTTPSIPAGATGYNLYRRGPSDTRYHFIASGDVTEFVDGGQVIIPGDSISTETFLTTEAGVSSVTQPIGTSRTIPTNNTTNATSSVLIDVTDEIPEGYTWTIYRSLTSNFEDSLLIRDISSEEWSYEDVGEATEPFSPPTAQFLQAPEKVVLTEGAEVQGFLPAEMVAVDDTDLSAKGETLDVILNGLDSALDPTTMGISIGPTGSGAMFECDGVNDELQFAAAYALANQEPTVGLINVHRGEYTFNAGCVVPSNWAGAVLRAYREEMHAPGNWTDQPVTITHMNPSQPMFTIDDHAYFQGLTLQLGSTANNNNYAPGATLIDASGCDDLVIEGCYMTSTYYGPSASPGIAGPYSAFRVVDSTIYMRTTKPFITIQDYSFGFISRNQINGGGNNGIYPPFVGVNHTGIEHEDDYAYVDISNNYSDGWYSTFVDISGFTSQVRIEANRLMWSADDTYSLIKVANGSRIDILNNFLGGDINLTGCRDVRVRGNSLYESAFDGILLTDCLDCEVTGNTVVDPGWAAPGTYSGIRVTGTSTGNIIANNKVRQYETSHARFGIFIEDLTSIDNEVRDNNLGDLEFVDNGTDTFMGMVSYLAIVNHGADANKPRPSVPGPVLWRGTVLPQNSINGDDWLDYSPGGAGAIDGGAL